jgi:hypothetical protein
VTSDGYDSFGFGGIRGAVRAAGNSEAGGGVSSDRGLDGRDGPMESMN